MGLPRLPAGWRAEADSTADAADSAAEEQPGRVDLFNDSENPFHADLLPIRDGITADLTPEVPVDVGLYRNLRFIGDGTRVTLVEGASFQVRLNGTWDAPGSAGA